MIRQFVSAVIGRGIARRAGGNGLLGAAAGIGVSILARRLVPLLGAAAARKGYRFVTRERSAHDNDDTQSAGA